jgi:glucan biosynthesis protein C
VRRADLDLLRVVLCAAVILQHAILIFAQEPRYHVKSELVSPSASAVYEALRIFAMPPFFALAGWASIVSLRTRGTASFLRERAARLLLPLLVGIAVLGPPIKYIELRGGRDLSLNGFRMVAPLRQGFLEFLPQYYTRIALLTWSHLWFLVYLLLYSLLLLPLLVHLARRPIVAAVPPTAWAYLPALPMLLLLAVGQGYWPYLPNLLTDWTNTAYFAVCFVIGAGIAVWPGFGLLLRAEAPRTALLAACGLTIVLIYGESLVGRLAVGATAWGCIGASWGLVERLQPRRTAILNYLSEASLPVYIIHHLPLLLLALWVLQWGLPIWPQIGIIALGDVAISLVLFHFLVRPWYWGRWLLGMPATHDRAVVTRAVAQAQLVSRT